MRFAKAHAYGNDFLYVQAADVAGAALDTLARLMCDRHQGVGADGLIAFARDADEVVMQLLNADGGRAEVSGNGLRGLAALLLQIDTRLNAELAVRTDGGVRRLIRVAREGSRQTFRAAMGAPSAVRAISIDLGAESIDVVTLRIGNPHCVLIGPLPSLERFRTLGEVLERHPEFPGGTNVEFAHVEAPNRVRILVWERGVGATNSSGTGSCAALVATAAFGGANREAHVIAPGGSQWVEWNDEGVYLTGWAEVICEGEWLLQIPTRTGEAESQKQ
jgi:diaminopimelate epimerase